MSHLKVGNVQADIYREEKNIIDLYVMLLRFSRSEELQIHNAFCFCIVVFGV